MKEFNQFIFDLKKSVNNSLIERAKSTSSNPNADPSQIWVEVISVFRYLMNLSPEDFINIRFHTGLINGDPWRYWHAFPVPNPEEEAHRLGYTKMIKEIPENFWSGEPATPHLPRPMGINYRGHLLNSNIVRFQRCVSTLYFSGILSWIAQSEEKQIIMEIGGGYGGLAHNITSILKDHTTYIIVDLPEMFLFQGAFLKVNNPEKSIYIYDPETFDVTTFARNVLNYDFILIPNYVLDKLAFIKDIAVFINMQSFQEMTDSQVQEYLDFAAEHTTGCIYSDNVDCHPYNYNLSSISDLLRSRFELIPSPKKYDTIDEMKDHRGWGSYKQYIGYPKGKSNVCVADPDLELHILRMARFEKHSLTYRILQKFFHKLPVQIRKRIAI